VAVFSLVALIGRKCSFGLPVAEHRSIQHQILCPTIPFHRRIMNASQFVNADFDINYVERMMRPE